MGGHRKLLPAARSLDPLFWEDLDSIDRGIGLPAVGHALADPARQEVVVVTLRIHPAPPPCGVSPVALVRSRLRSGAAGKMRRPGFPGQVIEIIPRLIAEQGETESVLTA